MNSWPGCLGEKEWEKGGKRDTKIEKKMDIKKGKWERKES